MFIKLVFESFCRMLIRFFDNRAVRNNDVEYYRMELDKQRQETQRIIDHLLMPKVVTPVVEEEIDYRPINTSKFVSWTTKRSQLEQQSRDRAKQLEEEARTALGKIPIRQRTTEELENELGVSNG